VRYLGLDLGTKTLGLALSDRTGLVASYYENLRYEDEDKLISSLLEIIEKENVKSLVLGLPKNMNNSLGFRAQETMAFKEKLSEKVDMDIFLEDERLTTKVAESILISGNMSRKKRKKVIDGLSAVVILQAYLDKKNR
jgi:putative Holliday junction resolvase